QDTVYTPGGLLVVFAAIFAGAIFHEFGHASVLRSHGGRVRGMGVGLYLMYPAFYTDVSDCYRLGRWARVFTDLGGIYFHLIFVVYVVGAVPLLAYLFVVMLQALPTFLLQSWDALRVQAHMFSQINVRSDYWVVVLLLVQMALLCMTILATIYFFWLVIKKTVSVAWKWARDDSRKKLALAVATSCLSVFLAV